MKKRYENFTIETRGKWISIFKDGEFCASVPTVEEARRFLWIQCGKGEPIADEMLEVQA
jgi:hypothetical protein